MYFRYFLKETHNDSYVDKCLQKQHALIYKYQYFHRDNKGHKNKKLKKKKEKSKKNNEQK